MSGVSLPTLAKNAKVGHPSVQYGDRKNSSERVGQPPSGAKGRVFRDVNAALKGRSTVSVVAELGSVEVDADRSVRATCVFMQRLKSSFCCLCGMAEAIP